MAYKQRTRNACYILGGCTQKPRTLGSCKPNPNVVRVTNRWLDDPEEDFTALSSEEARQWRLRQPASPTWHSIAWQIGIGLTATAVIGMVWRSGMLAQSVAFGVFAVVVPNALLLRGMSGAGKHWGAEALLLRLLVWELVKLAVTFSILYSADKVLGEMSWPALLAGLVVTMKANWFVLAFQQGANRSPGGKG